jgi:hypothetical protein
VLVDIVDGRSTLPLRDGDLAVSIPLAIYLAGLWFVRDRLVLEGIAKWILLPFAVVIAFVPFVFPALEVIAGLMVAAVATRIAVQKTNRASG